MVYDNLTLLQILKICLIGNGIIFLIIILFLIFIGAVTDINAQINENKIKDGKKDDLGKDSK